MWSFYTNYYTFWLIKDISVMRGCIQKFPDWVDNEIDAYNNKYSLWSNEKSYGGKTH
jgi:hypothetical protein